jgi:hypothetical protein
VSKCQSLLHNESGHFFQGSSVLGKSESCKKERSVNIREGPLVTARGEGRHVTLQLYTSWRGGGQDVKFVFQTIYIYKLEAGVAQAV